MAVTGDPWPAEIRGPLREGWQSAPPSGVRRSTMDDGTAKRRVESTAIGAVEAFVFKLPDDQFALLDAHYADNKALRFEIPHPVWGDVEACYESAPSYSERGLFKYVNVRLEIFR